MMAVWSEMSHWHAVLSYDAEVIWVCTPVRVELWGA